MSIYLTPEQEDFVRTKLELGKYGSAEEVLEAALNLLDAHDSAESTWVADVREKIDAAITASENSPAVDGETVLNGILSKLQQARQAQE
jgi:antitoxin ParD1/3/4